MQVVTWFQYCHLDPDLGGRVRGIARQGRVHDIESFRPNIFLVGFHPTSPIAMDATITKSFDLHLFLDGKSKHRSCWSLASIYNCLWNSMVDDLEHPPFTTRRCHLLHNFLSSSATSRRLRLLQGCKIYERNYVPMLEIIKSYRWGKHMNPKFFFFITHLTDRICLNPHEMKLNFSTVCFFVFWDQTKKPNELENIPLSTVITRVSIDSFTLTMYFWNPWTWVSDSKGWGLWITKQSLECEVFGFDEWWIFCACFLCGINSYEWRSFCCKEDNWV